ncbi:hypothetical protein LTR08_003235 [Meristemomyces frigidus]|nr:hypothetical protein LTR08_003235 [Meristemomyces frigidus]
MFGSITSKEMLVASIDDFVKISMLQLGEGKVDFSDEGDQLRQRWAVIIRRLADAAPVPGANVGDCSKVNAMWKYEAAYCLLLTALMEIHRADPEGYFSNLLGAIPASARMSQSSLLAAYELDTVPSGKTSEPSRKKQRLQEPTLLVASNEEQEDDSGDMKPVIKSRASRRSKTSGKAVREKLGKKASKSGHHETEALVPAAGLPGYYRRDRKNANVGYDAPKTVESSGMATMEDSKLKGWLLPDGRPELDEDSLFVDQDAFAEILREHCASVPEQSPAHSDIQSTSPEQYTHTSSTQKRSHNNPPSSHPFLEDSGSSGEDEICISGRTAGKG